MLDGLLSKIPKIGNHRCINIGLAVTTASTLIILIICFSTFGWVVDYYSCDFSLQEAKCDTGTSDLTGDSKKAADVMIGMGSMCFIFLFINLCINVVIALEKFTRFYPYMTLAGVALCVLTWIFMVAGWGHYADKKGGTPGGSVDYGASFAFVVLIWLGLFPYTFFWLVLASMKIGDGPDPNAPQPDPNAGEPNSSEYPSAGPVYTSDNNNPPGGGNPDAGHSSLSPRHTDENTTQPPAVPAHQEPSANTDVSEKQPDKQPPADTDGTEKQPDPQE
jgi:hypothetical protein